MNHMRQMFRGARAGLRHSGGLLAVSLVLVAVGLAAAACGGGGGASVQSRFQQAESAFKHKDWKALYNLYSPAARKDCSYGQFLDAVQSNTGFQEVDWSKVQFKDVKVTTSGDTATTGYTVTYDGQDIQDNHGDPQSWVKVDGTWYSDAENACNDIRADDTSGSSGSSSSSSTSGSSDSGDSSDSGSDSSQ